MVNIINLIALVKKDKEDNLHDEIFAAPTILLISLFLGSSTAYALTPADLMETPLPVTVEIQIE